MSEYGSQDLKIAMIFLYDLFNYGNPLRSYAIEAET